jgi:hypothetical protein
VQTAPSASGPIQLSRNAPASVALRRTVRTDHKLHSAAPGSSTGTYLVLSGVDLPVPVNGTYNVFLNLPQNASATPESRFYVGTFGSFEIMNQGGHHGGDGGTLVFEISEMLAGLPGNAAAQPRVTFVPVGSIRYAPSVESVSIVTH